MKRLMNKKLNLVLAVALTIVALTTGQTAWAESTWTVTNNNGNSNTFTIKRSETGYVQKVLYRTISLSAYAGQHFTAKYGELEFKEDEDTKTVTVNELSPTGAYLYYTNGTTVKYGFEVTDRAGFRLDYAERSKTWGTSVPASGIFDEKELNIHSNPITVTDGGYAQAYHSVNVGNYYTAAPKSYLTAVGAQLRMTVTFDAREKDDGYQYIQIYANTTADADHTDTGAKNGNPGTINYSKYMAGFTIDGNVSSTYYPYTFPLTSKGSNCGYVAHPWSGNSNGNLEQQYFNTNCRATDGRLIIPTELTSLYVRFNASGNNSDTWYAQNVKAHIQAVDGTNPTKSAVSVNPGRHAKGNTVYVSVAFSEIVTSTNATLSTSWGPMTLEAGSGTNVLTFSTTIPQDATGNLNITGISGTIKDLAGKSLSGGVTASNLCSLDADFAYAINDFQQEDGNYLIKTHEDLIGLAGFVNSGNKCKNLTFLQVADIAFPHATNWNSSSSTENNYIAIGTYDNPFCGTFSGQAHTISGIRIYKSNTSNLGLFGAVMENGTVKRVNLVDARITAGHCAAGIVGRTYIATIEDCTVGDDVCIHTAQSEIQSHGGIVGANQGAPVRRCISRATLTVADGLNGCYCYGGIVGKNWSDTITDCIAEGVVIPDVNGRGAIVGYKENVGTLTRNYYRGCTVAGVANATGVGRGNGESSKTTSDVDGARALYAITLGTNVTIDRTPATDPLPGTNNMTYDNGADINGLAYAYAGATVTLGYSGNNIGYHVEYSTTAGTLEGNTLTMPSEDVTVSATVFANTYTVHFNKNHNDAEGTMGDQTLTYDVAQTLTANTFKRGGYTFSGWNTQTDGNGTSYTDEQEVSNLTDEDGVTITLYAQWTLRKDAVTLSVDPDIPEGTAGHYYVTFGRNSYGDKVLPFSTDDLAAGKNVFKIYDDGGKDGNHSSGCQSKMVIYVPKGYIIQVAGTVWTEYYPELVFLRVFDNDHIDSDHILATVNSPSDGEETNFGPVTTTGKAMCLYFRASAYETTYQGVDLTVTVMEEPRYNVSVATGIEHGTVTPSGTSAYWNDNITLTLTPDEGYTIGTVTWNDGTDHVITPVNNVYSFAMPQHDVTVSATFQDEVGYYWGEGNDGSAEHPYVIRNKAGWDLLVTKTTSYNNITNGKYFELSKNISDVTESVLYFGGHLNGKGHKITLAMNDNSGQANGLIWSAASPCTISNLTLDGSIVSQGQYVGSFMTQSNLSVTFTNCRSSVAITSSYSGNDFRGGGFIGYTGDNSILIDCCVFDGSFTSSNNLTFSLWVGGSKYQITHSAYLYGGEAHFYNGVNDSNILAYRLMFVSPTSPAIAMRTDGTAIGNDAGMIYADGFTLDGDEYYKNGATVTFGVPKLVITAADYQFSTFANFPATINADGTASFIMPQWYTTATITGLAAYYIDADGNGQYCTDFTVIKSSKSYVSFGKNNEEHWYVVTDDVTVKGRTYSYALQFSGDTHLILFDGASLTASLALQTVSGLKNIVKVNGNLTIYGQSEGTGTLTTSNTVSQTGSSNHEYQIMGIYSSGNMTINGGIVQASATDNSSENNYTCGIKTNGDFTFNGGHVSATASNSYRIYGLYADGSITLGWRSPSDRFYAKTYNKDVTIRDGQAFSNGQSVYSGTVNKNNLSAKTLQPAAALGMNSAGIMTYASPYALDLSNVNAYVVSDYNSGNSTLTLTKATEAPANTGLLLKAKDDGQKNTTIALPLQESAEAVGENLLVGVTDGATIVHQTEGSYTNFILANGKYGIDWYTLSEAGAIGANKAYLQLPTAEVSNGRAFTWVYDDGTATKIERPTPDPSLYGGEWYTLNGVKLSGKPTTKGLYIHNGRKEVVR